MSMLPDFGEVIGDAIRSHMRHGLWTALPGRVESYDAAKQLCTVKPMVHDAREDEAGDWISAPLPVISGVPVVWLAAGGFRITAPLKAGDGVLLIFASRSLDTWLESGEDRDPVDLRMHHLTDAIAIPGLHPNTKPLTGAATSGMTIGHESGTQIHITADGIALGEQSPSDSVALASKVEAELGKLWSALSTVAGATTPPTTAGVSAAKALRAGVGSTTVKVKG